MHCDGDNGFLGGKEACYAGNPNELVSCYWLDS